MRRLAWTVFAALAMTIAAVFIIDSARFASAESKHYGFIDLESVLENYAKNEELTKRLSAEFQAAAEKIQREEESIRLQREELAMLERGGKKYEDTYRQIMLREKGVEYDKEMIRRRIDGQKAAGWKELYRDIQIACEKIAKDQGLDAVLVMNRRSPNGRTDEEMMSQITLRQVIYFDPQLDVTDDVLASLNR